MTRPGTRRAAALATTAVAAAVAGCGGSADPPGASDDSAYAKVACRDWTEERLGPVDFAAEDVSRTGSIRYTWTATATGGVRVACVTEDIGDAMRLIQLTTG